MSRGSRFADTRRYGRGLAIGANILGHTIGDREEALAILKQGFDQVYSELGHRIGTLPYEGSAERVKAHPEWYLWWTSVAVPVFDRFAKFHSDQSGDRTGPLASYVGFGEKFSTDWDKYEAWSKTLTTLRESAERIGMSLSSPAPAALPTTIYQDVANKVSDLGGELHTLAKVGLYGALGIGAALGVVEVVKLARGK